MKRQSRAFLPHALLALAAFAAAAGAGPAEAAPVLLVSLDGLRPADVIEADARGIKVPVLRRIMAEGAYSSGVRGVLPTLTYPSHATLITGVAPGKHGISNNLTFDPTGINQIGWDWYASDFRVATLWDAAKAKGLVSVNVHWPVSVGGAADFNLPQIWRTGHDDDRKLLTALATPGLVKSLEAKLGPYAMGIDESVEGDAVRTRFAAELITEKHPALTTVYFAGIDHIEHLHGPGSPEAKQAIEATDALVGQLVDAARKADRTTVIAVVSDHGFQPVETDVNLFAPFVQAGLIRIDAAGKVTGWDAEPWLAGGSAGVVLARPDDAALVAKVRALLDTIKADPAYGIASVIDRAEIARRGGPREASFFIDLKPGYETGRNPAGPIAGPSGYKGMHGYFPEAATMRSSLFVTGPDLARHGDLGEIDMRDIAPSLARVLGVSLPEAEGKPVF
ncbi:alkaline phosphatase family protein [Flavisphingomonas formosensis]|uniref:alkaline phosphatase family protein n=1 Tax=Flavisphingomonas formosensis TaxID=861534 RepID=UPI0012FC045C|nr:ectonucleotide pyrophosphatase/phosphodiesterase [Sphingomonas formosensis]